MEKVNEVGKSVSLLVLLMGDQNDQLFEVETIVDAKWEDNRWYYRVKWKDYPHTFNTWEDEYQFSSDDSIKEFWKIHKKDDYLTPQKVLMLPKNTMELTNSSITISYLTLFPPINDESEINQIIDAFRANGEVILSVQTTLYPRPVQIPSRALRKIAPKKLIAFYQSRVEI